MSYIRLVGTLLKRLLFFLVAGAIAVFLLHAQAGILRGAEGVPATFSVHRWATASTQYLTGLLRGDLGGLEPLRVASYMEPKPVLAELASRAPASLLLLLLALAVGLGVGTLLGLLSSRFGLRGLRAPTTLGSMLLLSTPDILVVLGLRLLVIWGLSTLGVKLFAFSAFGGALQASNLIAPVVALSALPAAIVARVSAVAFDEIHAQLYIRAALAKGVTHARLVFRHALKNAWIRVAEAGPLVISSLVTGLVVVEYILYFPGIGRTLGLILERRGQPAASSGIALVLLLFAALIDVAFATFRLALDPRLKEAAGPQPVGQPLPDRLAAGLRAWPAALVSHLREWPAAAAELAWAWRPSRLLREVIRTPALLIGLIGVGALALIALFGGQFIDLTRADQVPRQIIVQGEVFFPPYKPGTLGYPLGSDMAGRDLLARLIIGARYTFFFTLAITPIRFLVALPWGLAAGLRGGLWRAAGQLLGLLFSALPVLLIPAALLPLVPVLSSLQDGSAYWLITGILALAGIPRLVEQVRQHTEALAVQPFMEGAVAVGASTGRIFWRHLLPHLAPQLWVTAAADMAWTLLLLAQFGVFSIYLAGSVTVMTGFEVMSNTSTIQMSRIPDWSSMLSRPYDALFRTPWSIWLPALCFLLTIIAFNLVAEGLRRRAQALHTAPSMAEVPRARRRLALEWSGAVTVAALLVALILRFGQEGAPPAEGVDAQTPVEQARLVLGTVLDKASAAAPSSERSEALAALKPAVVRYLKEIQQAKLPLSTIVTDTQGRFRLLDGPEFQLLNVVIPNDPTGSRGPSYAFVVDKASGKLNDLITTKERVEQFTVLRRVRRLPTQKNRAFDYVILAGPMPQVGDRWGLSVWSGSYGENQNYPYSSEDALIQGFHRSHGGPLGLEIVPADVGQALWLALPNPAGRYELGENGDLTVCLSAGDAECTAFPWIGRWGWVPSS